MTGTCATAINTAAKVITLDSPYASYTPQAGDEFFFTFTAGNNVAATTLDVNGSGARNVRINAVNIGGNSTSFGLTAGASVRFYFDGTYYCLYGSQDISDADSTNISNIYAAGGSSFVVSAASVSTLATSYYPFIGVLTDGTIDKITDTSTTYAASARTFTPNAVSLRKNIMFSSNTTTAWTKNAVYGSGIFSQLSIGATNWKYAIYNYYDKSGVLQVNTTTTDLVNTDLYIGGTLGTDGVSFVPKEFSLTLRDMSLVYRRIGRFQTAGFFFLMTEQPVYKYWYNSYDDYGEWREWTSETTRGADSVAGYFDSEELELNADLFPNDSVIFAVKNGAALQPHLKDAYGNIRKFTAINVGSAIYMGDNQEVMFFDGELNEVWFRQNIILPDGFYFEAGDICAPASRWGKCTTAAATVAKTVSTWGRTLTLAAGVRVAVLFQSANSAANPTLNVNGSGAYPMFRNGVRLTGSTAWNTGETYTFEFDGTNWNMLAPVTSVGGGKKVARAVIGSTGAGYTAADVDFLCTGSNDSTMFDNALAAIATGGGEIKILDGTYTLTKPWAIEKAGVKVTGSGAANTVLRMTGARNTTSGAEAAKSNNAVIYIGESDCVIEGLTLANGTSATSGLSYGIYVTAASNNIITGNTFSNSSTSAQSYGVYLTSSSNNTITGNTFSNSSTNGISCGVYLSSASNNTVTGNIWGGKSSAFTGFAFYFSGTTNVYNQIQNNSLCNWILCGAGEYTTDGTISSALPGSSTTIASFSAIGTASVSGFNMV
jgi:parallel beta-helix repeat protein